MLKSDNKPEKARLVQPRDDDGSPASELPPSSDALVGQALPEIPPKLYRIGELVEYAGISRQTIHNYVTMGLLPERRWTKGGHRLFDEETFARLATIQRLKAQHRSMQYIREDFDRLDTATRAPPATGDLPLGDDRRDEGH